VFEIAERGTRSRAGFQAVQDDPAGDDRPARHAAPEPGQITGVTTGFTELDRMTTGFSPAT
jgi:replicative DNA helicase